MLLVILAAVVAIAFFSYKHRDFFAIDACLDRGSAWDYEVGKCEADDANVKFRL